MKNLGLVLGVAAVATLAGCKDPDYVGRNGRAPQNEVKEVATEVAKPADSPVEVKEETSASAEVKAEPVAKPVTQPVPEKPVAQPVPEKPAEPAFTWYTVRRGDYLAKISKKYNVTINGIKKINPKLKGDVIMIGQKIKLPGVHNIEAAPVEAAKPAAAKSANKVATDYTGATVEYVVKNGDTLGGIAYGHGINIRTLKKMNNLSSDALKIGQKLKVPANGKPVAKEVAKPVAVNAVAAEKPAPVVNPPETDPAAVTEPAPAPSAEAAEPASDAATVAAEDAAAKPAALATPAFKTYVVQEGDDMAGLSVAWGVTASQIRELNNLGEGDQLKPGQTIRVPAEADLQ